MKRKLNTIVWIAMAIVLVLAGCTSNSGNNAASSSSAASPVTSPAKSEAPESPGVITNNGVELTPPGTFPITKEKVTLKVFVASDPNIEDLKTNLMTQEYEDMTNVHIEWIEVSSADVEQRKNLLLSTNQDLPDIFLGANISPPQQAQYGSQGVLLPLNDVLARQSVHINAMFEKEDNLRESITAPDGNIYSLPSVVKNYQGIFAQKLWINKTWLEKLKLDMPTTTEEYYNVLKAFKTQDPNGNNKADEIPLTGAHNGARTEIYGYFMNAFIQFQSFNEGPFILKDGKVSIAVDQPEYREGLRYLRKLHDEGLLDPGAITQDSAQLKQLAANKDAQLLGSVTAQAMTGFMVGGSPMMKDFTSVPPLKGPGGVQTTGYFPFNQNIGKFAIASSSKYPDVALRWIDWFFSQDGLMRSVYGRKDIEWRDATPDEKGFDGTQGNFFRIFAFGKTQNVHWNSIIPRYSPLEFTNKTVANPEDQATILYNETAEKYAPYQPKEVMPPVFMTAEESEEYLAIHASMKEYMVQSAARFVIGDLDIDKDWDSYLEQLNKIGLKRYIELNQQAYDRGYKK